MSDVTRIDLLRHGAAAGGARLRGARDDDPLTDTGRAAMAAAVTAVEPWDVVITSPLQRCHEFAAAAAADQGAVLRAEPRWREYDFGDWSGRDLEALWHEQGDALATFLADPDAFTPPHGEAPAAFRERVRSAFADWVGAYPGASIGVIGHGGVLRQIVADALGIAAPVHPKLEWPPAAMTRIKAFDGGAGGFALAFHARSPERGRDAGAPADQMASS